MTEDERTSGDPVSELDETERVAPGRPSEAHLSIVDADGTWRSRPLPTDGRALIIGRSAGVDIRVDEQRVSRLHARLEATGAGKLRLIDLGSANGTWVGSRHVRDAGVMVRPGEPILIGRTEFAVHAPQPMRASTRSSGDGSPPSLPPALAREDVDRLIAKAAPTLVSVLLLGETGVGKGVAAERIHRLSTRSEGPLLRVNCAGLSVTLLESELFGHERGAFTGAVQAKQGLLEAAAGGTVFLDEVGEMPMEVQAKLLHAIEQSEQREARRVGATRGTPLDVRFICATHRDLQAEIRCGRFREDFYYRINEFTILIPPLRERRDELDGLISQFASEAAARMERGRPPAFDDAALAQLRRYHWPGNIRELRAVVKKAVLLADGDAVTPSILADAWLPADAAAPSGDEPPGDPLEDTDADRVRRTLARCGGNQSRAARMLGISRNTLRAWMRKYGIPLPRGPEALR